MKSNVSIFKWEHDEGIESHTYEIIRKLTRGHEYYHNFEWNFSFIVDRSSFDVTFGD